MLTESKIVELEGRVAAGVEFLDQSMPSWWVDIDLETLDLMNCERCVLGQVVANVTNEHVVVGGYYLLAEGRLGRQDQYRNDDTPEEWLGKITAQFGVDFEPMDFELAVDRGFHLRHDENVIDDDNTIWKALTAIWNRAIGERQAA